jgi:hypothetical protein
MAPPNRGGGGGLSARTLAIASAASLTAAIVTSRLFPPGTIYASALTPVIVAAVNEMLSRPVDRVAALREQRRTMVLEASEARVSRAMGEEPSPLRGAPDFALGAEAEEETHARSGNGHRAGDRLEGVPIHGRTRRRRILHPKVWVTTGLVAFAIAAAVLTLPELIFGGAVATNHRTTLLGGGTRHTTTQKKTTKTDTSPATTGTGTSPTETTTTSGGAPAPSGTDSSTTPVPAQP